MQRVARITIAFVLITLLTTTGIFGLLLTVVGMNDMPDVHTPLTSTFYHQNGEVLATRFEQNRFAVTLDEMSPYLVEGFIAVEDHRFYRHLGIDPFALSRATLRNLREGSFVEGGSTITQQLARNLFLTHDKTITRKIQEALLTIQLERRFTKQEILEKYLNTIYFGFSAYGVEAASRTYFGKSAHELSLAESAMLAGIPRGPAYYSPWINFEAAKKRQAIVLSRMVDQGVISPQEREEALAEEIKLRERVKSRDTPRPDAYFIDHLINYELPRIFPDNPQIVYQGGLQLYTTLDKTMQEAAAEAAAELPVFFATENGVRQPQIALVALDPHSGAVRALVGGRDYRETQFNRAIPPVSGTTRGRSPGSAFKPFMYAAALESGYTPATTHTSEPVSFTIPGQADPYEPSEYGGNFFDRPLTMREALARSSNVVAVKTHMDIGPENTVLMAKRLGITSPLNAYPSLPLGTSNVTPLEMALAYTPFANQGISVKPLFIDKITDAQGNLLYESQPLRSLALDARIAYLITDMLKDVLRPGGTGAHLEHYLLRPVAAKTGTSEDHRDSYIVGYTPDLVAALWIGNDNSSSLGGSSTTGSRLAGPIWGKFMSKALQNTEPRDFPVPEGLTSVEICPYTGLLHNPLCSLTPRPELFISGTEPSEQCSYPQCPYCPPERQWHWDSWWFR